MRSLEGGADQSLAASCQIGEGTPNCSPTYCEVPKLGRQIPGATAICPRGCGRLKTPTEKLFLLKKTGLETSGLEGWPIYIHRERKREACPSWRQRL